MKRTSNLKTILAFVKYPTFDPKSKSKEYSLTQTEMETVLSLLQKIDLKHLKKEYTTNKTDQPTSTIIIKTESEKFEIKDYGLEGEYPLKQLYKIVYKLDETYASRVLQSN